MKQLDEGDNQDLEPEIMECDEMWSDFDNLVAKAEEGDLLSQAEVVTVIAAMLVYSSTQRPSAIMAACGEFCKRWAYLQKNETTRIYKYPGTEHLHTYKVYVNYDNKLYTLTRPG